jgi:hypothetical protein
MSRVDIVAPHLRAQLLPKIDKQYGDRHVARSGLSIAGPKGLAAAVMRTTPSGSTRRLVRASAAQKSSADA